MLDKLGNRFQGIVLGLVVVVLCAVFILQFGGPQAQGCTGTDAGAKWGAEVYGTTITEGEFRAAYALAGGSERPAAEARRFKLKELVLDGLIERELLAREAEDVGFHVTEDDVMRKLADDGSIYFSAPVDAPAFSFPPNPIRVNLRDEHGKFDADGARAFIQYRLRRSVAEFALSQVRETMAQHMRDLVLANVTVSPNEVWDAFAQEREHATLKYVRYSPVFYRDTLEPTRAEVETWAAAHAADVDREYTRQRHRYTNLEKQVRSRHILIKVEESATDEQRAEARARIDALLVRVRAGEDFATLARQNSDDTGSARKGGDLGYNPRGRMVAPFDTAQFALAPGEVSDVVTTTFGFHIIRVEGVREGDVPAAEAKLELAENLYRESRANEMAQQAAQAALRGLSSGTTMEELAARLRAAAAPPVQPGQPTPPVAPPPSGDEDEEDETGDPLAPRVRTTRPFGRTESPIPGPFDSGPLARAAYDLTTEHPLPREPLRLGDEWFVYRLESREDPRRSDFTAAEQARIQQGLLGGKRREVLAVYVRRLRHAAEADGALHINDEILRYDADSTREESASR